MRHTYASDASKHGEIPRSLLLTNEHTLRNDGGAVHHSGRDGPISNDGQNCFRHHAKLFFSSPDHNERRTA